MAKQKKTKLQIEYQKELKSLKRRIRYAYNKKGYVFEELPIPDTPKKITRKSINELKNLRGEELWKKATYQEYESDYDYEDTYQSYEDNVLQGVEERISSFTIYDFDSMYTGLWHEQNKDKLQGLLEMAIADEGRTTVAWRLENQGSTRINELVDRIMHDSDDSTVQASLQEFSEIIYNGAMHPISEYGY